MFKANNRNTRTRCEICSKVSIKTSERRYCRRSDVFIVNFEHSSHLVLVFLLLACFEQRQLESTLIFDINLWYDLLSPQNISIISYIQILTLPGLDLVCHEQKQFEGTLHLKFIWHWFDESKAHLPISLLFTHFIALVSFDTPWKHEKTSGFLMFSGGVERPVAWNWLTTFWFTIHMQQIRLDSILA